MDQEYLRKTMTTAFLLVLIVLAFFLLRPILLSIITGLILAFIFMPVYNFVHKYIRSKNLSATIICILLAALIIIPFWFITPIIIEQSFKIYLASQQIDLITPIKTLFPTLSAEFSAEIGAILHSFITRTTNFLVNFLSQLILDFPSLFLRFLVVVFTFFFVLKDKDKLVSYIQSLLPFSKEVERKLFDQSKGITSSVIYGQVIIGMIQGLLAGLGFFIFGVPNALLLTLLAAAAGIFPIVGPTIVWIPVAIFLLLAGNTVPAVGVIAFGLASAFIDNFIRPIIVAKRTSISSPVILIGMIGGLFLFGILGFILGPLILAYLFIILELYRNKSLPGVFIHNPTKG